MKDRTIYRMIFATLAGIILIPQFGIIESASFSPQGEEDLPKEICSNLNDSSKFNEHLEIQGRIISCMELFYGKRCTGTPTVVIREVLAFPELKDQSILSFRKCLLQPKDYFACHSSMPDHINVTFSMLGVETQRTLKHGECELLPLTPILDSILTFSSQNESLCIQLYSSPDCTDEFHRIISKLPLVVYGFAPNVVKSVSLCNCSVINKTSGNHSPQIETHRNALKLQILGERASKDREEIDDMADEKDEVDMVDKAESVPRVFYAPILQVTLFFLIIAMCFCFPRAFFPSREYHILYESDEEDWVVI